jgi:hypothetical protein
MKNFIAPLLYTIPVYALLFTWFDKAILSICFAFVQMFILPAGYYFAVIQISLAITDIILIISSRPFVPPGLGFFLLIN